MSHRDRIAAFDALRVIGLVLGIAVHASVPYMIAAPPGLPWAVREPGGHAAFDWLFWAARSIQVPLFLLLSGFFSMAALAAEGARSFLWKRIRRLLVGFAAGVVLVLPVVYTVWTSGWALEGHATWDQIRRVKFDPAIQPHVYGAAHLWFLEDLLVVSIVLALVALVIERQPRTFERVRAIGIHPFWLAVSTCAALLVDRDATLWARNTFVPPPARVIYCATLFAGGALLSRRLDAIPRPRRAAACRLLSLASLVIMMGTLGLPPESAVRRPLFAASSTGLTWSAVMGLVGFAWTHVQRLPRAVSRIAEQSYEAYVLHLPILGALQIAASQVTAPFALKFVFVLGATLAITLPAAGLVHRWIARRPAPIAMAHAVHSTPMP